MWTDPYISKQLLDMHINPDHDMASRSQAKIEHISNWILSQTHHQPLKILDLGCGPGLYSEFFARRGHAVTGVDFSINSIQHASQRAKEQNLEIEYHPLDYLELDYAEQFDLVILIYLDFCMLLPEERDRVLKNIFKALKRGGLFICDVVNERNIDKKIIPQSWDAQLSGFWKETPYLALTKGYHYPEAHVLANHHIIIGENDSVDTYLFWTHYYDVNRLTDILKSFGFCDIETHENVLPETGDPWNGENVTFYVSRKDQ